MWINTKTKVRYSTHSEIRMAFPDVSMPFLLSDDILAFHGVYPIRQTQPTEYNHIALRVIELPPIEVNGEWTQQWGTHPFTAEEIEANQAFKAAADAKLVADKIDALWRAADAYTSGFISGVAIGILTIGAIQQKPKAQAVSAWSKSVWAEYYARKALVTSTSQDNHDFSMFGPMPHSVPELEAEIGL